MGRSVAEGRFVTPPHWPKWKLKCGAIRKGKPPCGHWAVVGMPTCKFHGSGGEVNRELGQLRYLCWVITGGPQDMPVKLACRVSLAVFAEAVLNRGTGTPEQQMRAAMWLTTLTDTHR